MFKFLVADDHPLFRDALIAVIRDGYDDSEILQSEDIEHTLSLASTHPDLDLILLDLNMPGMAGLKGLLELRNQFPTIPVAIISAETNKQIILQTIAYGAVALSLKARQGRKCAKRLSKSSEVMCICPPILSAPKAWRHQPAA